MWNRLSYRLESFELEAEFRADGLKRDTGVAAGLMLFNILFVVFTVPMDLELLGWSDKFFLLLAVRGAGVLVALASLLLLRRAAEVSFFDKVVFFWAAVLLIGIVFGNAMFPLDYTTHVAWDVFLVLCVYTVVPLSLGRQVLLASIMTVGDVVLFWHFKVLERPVAFFDVMTALVCANLVGIFASWELQRWRQREFLALHREEEARRDLEKAKVEIKTLRGIIPICASCKKVRTDEGHWQQVESYVRDHSDADFSHGICPECQRTLYPELFEEESG